MNFTEHNTNYAYKLKYMDTASFDEVRKLSANFCQELPQSLVDELYETLNRGVDLLDSEPQMAAYMYSFGGMHQAKLEFAFGKLPKDFLLQDEVDIVDWGCGQAIATMCYADFLRQNGYRQKVRTITLVEPSELCLNRAALHASVFFPDAEIKVVNKSFDELSDTDVNSADIPVLHVFSNVLDLQFDLSKFAALFAGSINGYAQFVCVGPYFGLLDKDSRMKEFAELLKGETSFSKSFEKGEFKNDWTAQVRCFSVGKLEEQLSTEVTDEDLENGVADEFGVVYSRDGKRLLNCKNSILETYTIKEGTKVVCDRAFWNCESLQSLTLPDSLTSIGRSAFGYCSSLQSVVLPASLKRIGVSVFRGCKSLHTIVILASLKRIGTSAFSGCTSLLSIELPASLKCIESSAFCGCTSLQSVVLPTSLKCIGSSAFCCCTSLQSVELPASLKCIESYAFFDCNKLCSIKFLDTIFRIVKSAFLKCSSLGKIIVPKNSVERFKEMLPNDLEVEDDDSLF